MQQVIQTSIKQHAFLPLLKRMGADVELELVRPGFYPAGGGKIQARITPAGDRVALSMSLSDEQMTALIRRNTFALKM